MNRGLINSLYKYLKGLFSQRKAVEAEPSKVFVARLKACLGEEYDRLYAPERSENFIMPRWQWALASAMAATAILAGVFYWHGTGEKRELRRIGLVMTDVESQIEMLDRDSQELAWLDNETTIEDLMELEGYK